MVRLYLGKIIFHIRKSLESLLNFSITVLIIAYERNEAHYRRRNVVKKNGVKIINRQIKESIKEYAKARFGSKSYWPFLALYTEIRGEFLKGWIPYDYYRFVLLPKINPKPASYLSDQKTFDHKLFGGFAIEPLLLFISGKCFNPEYEIIEDERLKRYLSDYDNKIVVKEECGMGGKQVRIIHSSMFIPHELKKDKNYVIQPYIKQLEVLNNLYPHSVNTFRVNTFLNNDGSVCVKYVWLRFGAEGSNVDNLSSGGYYLFFKNNGKPEEFVYDWKLGTRLSNKSYDTGFYFADLKIPMFNTMLNKCKSAHLKYPYVRLIAWDVCIDSNGEPRLIEWNTLNPDFSSQEARFGPFYPEDDVF